MVEYVVISSLNETGMISLGKLFYGPAGHVRGTLVTIDLEGIF